MGSGVRERFGFYDRFAWGCTIGMVWASRRTVSVYPVVPWNDSWRLLGNRRKWRF